MMCKMKNTQVRINGRLDVADKKISKPKGTAVEIIIKHRKKERNGLSIRELVDYFKHPNNTCY